MKTTTQIGIILLAIGLAFLVGTLYRSTSPYSFGYGNLLGLKANMWNSEGHVGISYSWSPRELRLDVNSNSTIDIYVLDSEGIRLWTLDGTLKPVWSAMGASQEIFTLQINNRDTYAFIVYNPTNVTVRFEINVTLYGYEKDLLWISIGFIVVGVIVTMVSLFMRKSKKHAPDEKSAPRNAKSMS
jgi:hypothetical protein